MKINLNITLDIPDDEEDGLTEGMIKEEVWSETIHAAELYHRLRVLEWCSMSDNESRTNSITFHKLWADICKNSQVKIEVQK